MFSKSCEEGGDITGPGIRIWQLFERSNLFTFLGSLFWHRVKSEGGNTAAACTAAETSAYRAASAVAAGVPSAFVDLGLTAGPSEAGPAGTGVAALARVATSGSIHARLVVGAVVEIWTDTTAHVDKPQANNWRDDSGGARMAPFVCRPTRLFIILLFSSLQSSKLLCHQDFFSHLLALVSLTSTLSSEL